MGKIPEQTPKLEPTTPPMRTVVYPKKGDVISSPGTGNIYTIGDEIGEGFFGKVYACDDVWGNTLAAKVLKPRGSYEAVRNNAIAELKKLVQLRHPNITYVFDAFEHHNTFYIITERCTLPLSALLRNQSNASLPWLVPIARCVLQAVHYLHLNRFAHQDIHPGNVYAALAKDEVNPSHPGAMQFKVGDLGVARLFGEMKPDNPLAQWMLPPEAINPDEFGPMDHHLDLYHVGLLLLQVAQWKEIQFSREEILAGRPREIALTLAPPLNFALEKALRRHVAFRTANAMELWRDLHIPTEATPSSPVLPPYDKKAETLAKG